MKNLNLNPQKQIPYGYSIKITITINKEPINFYNIYSTGRSLDMANQRQHFRSSPNCHIAGDFNAHHSSYYGEQSVIKEESIRNTITNSTIIT